MDSTVLESLELFASVPENITPQNRMKGFASKLSRYLSQDSAQTAVDKVNNSFKDLKINGTSPEDPAAASVVFLHAGTIHRSIPTMNSVLVAPCLAENSYLYLGSALFAKQNPEKFVFLGTIVDILGPVSAPFYQVEVKDTSLNLNNLKNGDSIFYSLEDPNIKYMSVKKSESGAYGAVKYKIRKFRCSHDCLA